MYCPKCGELLVDVEGELTCLAGEMGLARLMAEELYDCFVAGTRQPVERAFHFRWGGNWFCPGCGVKMIEPEQGAVICPQCHKNISTYLHQLIELHPHKPQHS